MANTDESQDRKITNKKLYMECNALYNRNMDNTQNGGKLKLSKDGVGEEPREFP